VLVVVGFVGLATVEQHRYVQCHTTHRSLSCAPCGQRRNSATVCFGGAYTSLETLFTRPLTLMLCPTRLVACTAQTVTHQAACRLADTRSRRGGAARVGRVRGAHGRRVARVDARAGGGWEEEAPLPPPHVDYISSVTNPYVKHCVKLKKRCDLPSPRARRKTSLFTTPLCYVQIRGACRHVFRGVEAAAQP
jgi:hypothetical protein